MEDTGIGLSDEALERVFEPFYQQEQVDERYGGTGLGLTIVKRLTEDLGGKISVQSEPGKGSVFTVRLPGLRAAAPEDGAVADAAASGGDDRRLDGADLLVVEDDPVSRDILARMLESRGALVRTAKDGEEALRATELRLPDAALTDLRMPKLDGFEFLGALREQSATKNLPVLIVTADLRAETRSRLAGFGSAMIVPKPVDRSMLLDCLQTVIPDKVIRAPDRAEESAPGSALTTGSLLAELGDEKATQAVEALAGPANAARKKIPRRSSSMNGTTSPGRSRPCSRASAPERSAASRDEPARRSRPSTPRSSPGSAPNSTNWCAEFRAKLPRCVRPVPRPVR